MEKSMNAKHRKPLLVRGRILVKDSVAPQARVFIFFKKNNISKQNENTVHFRLLILSSRSLNSQTASSGCKVSLETVP